VKANGDVNGTAVGLDSAVRVCLFDLDGVLTQTAKIHAQAWKSSFDAFLRDYDMQNQRRDAPFDEGSDYEQFVDGKTREDGVRSFLASRGIKVPEGDPNDEPGTQTVYGIGATKQKAFLALLEKHGPQVFDGSVSYVRAARAAGLGCAVVTSSANCEAILSAAGIADLFDATVDGHDVAVQGLRGKPAPDSYLAGAKALGVGPENAAVFEDALAGVESGRAGNFVEVVGVDRIGGDHPQHLREHGATVVVQDLSELLPTTEPTASAQPPEARR
jgi:beta-phosphoglucomutase family hydrolase